MDTKGTREAIARQNGRAARKAVQKGIASHRRRGMRPDFRFLGLGAMDADKVSLAASAILKGSNLWRKTSKP